MSAGFSCGDALRQAEHALEDAGVADARREAALLLAHALDCTREDLLAHPERPLGPTVRSRFCALLQRRAGREPMAYITGRREFWSLEFQVGPEVLIPRPETEHLVEAVLQAGLPQRPRIVDVGTGSGCVALALSREIPGATIVAADLSCEALQVASTNRARLAPDEGVGLLRGNVLDALRGDSLDVVASNPPYIPGARLKGLAPEVRDHEPRLALSPGEDGLLVTRAIIRGAGRCLTAGGLLALEIDAPACDDLLAELRASGWCHVEAVRDLAGLPRVITARRA